MSYQLSDYTPEEQADIKRWVAAGGASVDDDGCNDGAGDCHWDGESHRCDCGNRRMTWSSAGNGTVYPEAY